MKNKLRKWFSSPPEKIAVPLIIELEVNPIKEFITLQINNTIWTDIKYGKCNKWQWGLN